jgi:hypothetical protein
MPKKQKTPAQQNGTKPTVPKTSSNSLKYLREASDLTARIVDRFGWPGALIVLGFFFIQYNGTTAQKQEIIDKFVLGKDVDWAYPFAVFVALAVVAFWAQHDYWAKRVEVVTKEMNRLAEWKSKHQQEQTGSGLHSTENKK